MPIFIDMKLLKVKEYFDRQFDVLGIDEDIIYHVIRINDNIEFELDEPIYENKVQLKNGMEVNEQISIEGFHDDHINVDLCAWHFTDDYQCVCGVSDTVPINDIEKVMVDMLKASKKKFKEEYTT